MLVVSHAIYVGHHFGKGARVSRRRGHLHLELQRERIGGDRWGCYGGCSSSRRSTGQPNVFIY